MAILLNVDANRNEKPCFRRGHILMEFLFERFEHMTIKTEEVKFNKYSNRTGVLDRFYVFYVFGDWALSRSVLLSLFRRGIFFLWKLEAISHVLHF